VAQKALNTENLSISADRSPAFHELTTEAVFRGNIDLYKHYFSGIFALKKESEANYRMVLMSEVGMTLLDISYTSKVFRVNYCIEPLHKKALLKLLYHDFLLLTVLPGGENLKPGKRGRSSSGFIMFKSKYNRDFYTCRDGKVTEIISKAFFNRTHIQFSEMKMGLANSIHINHSPIKLEMILQRIK